VVLRLHSKNIKKEQYLQEHQIKVNYLFVIGQQDQLIRRAVKTKQ